MKIFNYIFKYNDRRYILDFLCNIIIFIYIFIGQVAYAGDVFSRCIKRFDADFFDPKITSLPVDLYVPFSGQCGLKCYSGCIKAAGIVDLGEMGKQSLINEATTSDASNINSWADVGSDIANNMAQIEKQNSIIINANFPKILECMHMCQAGKIYTTKYYQWNSSATGYNPFIEQDQAVASSFNCSVDPDISDFIGSVITNGSSKVDTKSLLPKAYTIVSENSPNFPTNTEISLSKGETLIINISSDSYKDNYQPIIYNILGSSSWCGGEGVITVPNIGGSSALGYGFNGIGNTWDSKNGSMQSNDNTLQGLYAFNVRNSSVIAPYNSPAANSADQTVSSAPPILIRNGDYFSFETNGRYYWDCDNDYKCQNNSKQYNRLISFDENGNDNAEWESGGYDLPYLVIQGENFSKDSLSVFEKKTSDSTSQSSQQVNGYTIDVKGLVCSLQFGRSPQKYLMGIDQDPLLYNSLRENGNISNVSPSQLESETDVTYNPNIFPVISCGGYFDLQGSGNIVKQISSPPGWQVFSDPISTSPGKLYQIGFKNFDQIKNENKSKKVWIFWKKHYSVLSYSNYNDNAGALMMRIAHTRIPANNSNIEALLYMVPKNLEHSQDILNSIQGQSPVILQFNEVNDNKYTIKYQYEGEESVYIYVRLVGRWIDSDASACTTGDSCQYFNDMALAHQISKINNIMAMGGMTVSVSKYTPQESTQLICKIVNKVEGGLLGGEKAITGKAESPADAGMLGEIFNAIMGNRDVRIYLTLFLTLGISTYVIMFLAGSVHQSWREVGTFFAKCVGTVSIFGDNSWYFFYNYIYMTLSVGLMNYLSNALSVQDLVEQLSQFQIYKGESCGIGTKMFNLFDSLLNGILSNIKVMQVIGQILTISGAVLAILTVVGMVMFAVVIFRVVLLYMYTIVTITLLLIIGIPICVLILFTPTHSIIVGWMIQILSIVFQNAVIFIAFPLLIFIAMSYLVFIGNYTICHSCLFTLSTKSCWIPLWSPVFTNSFPSTSLVTSMIGQLEVILGFFILLHLANISINMLPTLASDIISFGSATMHASISQFTGHVSSVASKYTTPVKYLFGLDEASQKNRDSS